MASVSLLPRAQRDLAAIKAYYANKVNESFAERYVGRIYKALKMLEANPKAGPGFTSPKGRKLRRLVVGYYSCVYKVVGEIVEIRAVYDSRRNPKSLGL